jgi:hypothetical protein
MSSGLVYNDLFNKNIQTLLYKKYQGYANTGLNVLLDGEYSVNASPSVYTNKVFLDTIPQSAPALNVATSFNDFPTYPGTVQSGTGVFNHIKKYTNIKLTSQNNKDTAFVYDKNNADGEPTGGRTIDSSDNILADAIAPTYDPNNTYAIKVSYRRLTDAVGTLSGEVFISNYTFDVDAGILSIYGISDITKNNPPVITFWRYEGRKATSGFASDWSKYGAIQQVDMSGFSIKGLPTIDEVNVTTKEQLLADVSLDFAASVGFVKKYFDLCGGSVGGAGIDETALDAYLADYMKIKNGAWDASGLTIQALADVSFGNISDLSAAVNVGTLKNYLDVEKQYLALAGKTSLDFSGLTVNVKDVSLNMTNFATQAVNYGTLTGHLASNRYISLSGNTLDLSNIRLDLSSAYVKDIILNGQGISGQVVNYNTLVTYNNSQHYISYSGDKVFLTNKIVDISTVDITRTDVSSSAVNVAALKTYVPAGTKQGEYLTWASDSSNTWSVGGDRVALGIAAVATDASGVAIGPGAKVAGSGIAIGANATNAGGNVPNGVIMLNATGVAPTTAVGSVAGKNRFVIPSLVETATITLNHTKTLYYDPVTGTIAAGDISGITAFVSAGGDVSGWYKYPAEQAVKLSSTTNDAQFIFGVKTPVNDGNFTYNNAITGQTTTVDATQQAIYNSMATNVEWVNTKLEGYLTTSYVPPTPDLTGYVTNSSLTTTLAEYSTTNEIKDFGDLNHYYDTATIDQRFSDLDLTYATIGATPDLSGWANYKAVKDVSMNSNKIAELEMPDWSANLVEQHKKYAVNKQYVDISDAGATASEQNPISVTNWLQKYVIDSPPAPKVNIVPTPTSQTAKFSFTNPTQIYVGAFAMRLPALNRFYLEISGNSTEIVSGSTTLVPDVSEVTSVIFGKSSSVVVDKLYNSDTKEYNVKFGGSSSGGSSDPIGSFYARVWYRNGNPGKINKLEVLLGPFGAAGVPTIPGLLAITGTIEDTKVPFRFTAPANADSNNTNDALTTSQPLTYKVTCTFVSTSRYNGANASTNYEGPLDTESIPTSENIISNSIALAANATGGFTSADNSLFPDTSYNYIVYASGDGGSNYSLGSTQGSFRTATPTAPTKFTTFTIPTEYTGTYYSRYAQTTGINGNVIPLVNIAGATFASTSNVAVHDAANIGKASGSYSLILTTKIKDGSNIISGEADNIFSIPGFGSSTVTNSAVTSSTNISVASFNDMYGTELTFTKRKGYYRRVTITPSIKSSIPTTYVGTAIGAGTDKVFTYSIAPSYGSEITKSFRLDGLSKTATPSFTNTSMFADSGSANFEVISGLSYLKNSAVLKISSTISNLLNLYYRASGVNITIRNGVSPFAQIGLLGHTYTDASGFTITPNTNNVTISNKEITFTYPNNFFATSIQANVAGRTIYDMSANGTATRNYLLDALNVAAKNSNSLPASESQITGSNRTVFGSPRNIGANVSATTNYSSGAVTDANYVHDTSLLSNVALQMVKGEFTTKGTRNDAYLNYSYNLGGDGSTDVGLNYSGITENRYMAFSASITSGISIGKFGITLNNVTLGSPAVVDNGVLTIQTKNVNIYYRLVSTAGNTVWIKATGKSNNISSSDAVTSTGVYDPLNNRVATGTSAGADANTVDVIVDGNIFYGNILPYITNPTAIYVMVEAPNDITFAFKSVSIQAFA